MGNCLSGISLARFRAGLKRKSKIICGKKIKFCWNYWNFPEQLFTKTQNLKKKIFMTCHGNKSKAKRFEFWSARFDLRDLRCERAVLTFMLWPAGLNHSNRNIESAAAWIATRETNIQLLVSKGSSYSYSISNVLDK